MTEGVLSEVYETEMFFCEKFTTWRCKDKVSSWEILNSTSPPNIEITAMMVRPCDQNPPANIGETIPVCYTHANAGQISTRD